MPIIMNISINSHFFVNKTVEGAAHTRPPLSTHFGGDRQMDGLKWEFNNSIIHKHECKVLFIIQHQNRILLATFAPKRRDFAI